MGIDPAELIRLASEARSAAYAPFSSYRVGAAVADRQGNVFLGCNVENASYGASVCAERVAVFKMVSEGSKEISAIAVATENGGPPCGMCLQVIREFVEDPERVQVYCNGDNGGLATYRFSELLPIQFGLANERSQTRTQSS